MAHSNRVDLRQPIHSLERLQHAAGIGTHQAVVVEAEIGRDRAWITVEDIIGAVVQSEGITGVENARAVIEREDRVRPVQVGSAKELKAMAHTAVAVRAEIQFVATFHRP